MTWSVTGIIKGVVVVITAILDYLNKKRKEKFNTKRKMPKSYEDFETRMRNKPPSDD